MREGNRTKLVLWGIFIALAGYLSLKGLSLDKETFVWMGINLEEQAVEVYLPSILESDGKEASLSAKILSELFVRGGTNVRSISEQAGADSETDRKIIKENKQFLVENLTKENQEVQEWRVREKVQWKKIRKKIRKKVRKKIRKKMLRKMQERKMGRRGH